MIYGVGTMEEGDPSLLAEENVMDRVSLHKTPLVRSRSAPAILINFEDTKQNGDNLIASVLNKINLEEMQDKLSVRPYSATWQFPRRIKPCSRVTRFNVSPLLQYGEKKEKAWLSDIFTRVGSLSRTMEQEKNKQKLSIGKKRAVTIIDEKVKRIGPHLEIFEVFNKKQKAPKKDKSISAATCIQKLIRGWLDRTRMNRLKMKAKNLGSNLGAVIKEYRKMMFRIKRRCGILDPTTSLNFEQLEDWMDHKKFYETMFGKREDLKVMDRNDLPKFFRDCGHFPSPNEINNTMKLVLTDSDSKIINISKSQAVEMAFMLYPPRGMKLKTAAVAKSTWVRPIIDGEDSYRYLTSGHPALKAADIRIAGALVAASIRERKRKECEADTSVFSGDSD